MAESKIKVIHVVCFHCGCATGVVNIKVLELGAKTAKVKGYCSHCAPAMHTKQV